MLFLLGQIPTKHICNPKLFANPHCQSRAVVKRSGALSGAHRVLPSLNYYPSQDQATELYFTSVISVHLGELKCLFDIHCGKAVICTIGQT